MMASSNGNIFCVTGPLCREFTAQRWIPPTLGGQCRGALVFSLIYAWTNGWVNTCDAGDLRHHRPYYDVTLIFMKHVKLCCIEVCYRETRLQQFSTSNPDPQIPQCTSPISHDAKMCNWNVHISATKWCLVGYLSDALWDLWARFNHHVVMLP